MVYWFIKKKKEKKKERKRKEKVEQNASVLNNIYN